MKKLIIIASLLNSLSLSASWFSWNSQKEECKSSILYFNYYKIIYALQNTKKLPENADDKIKSLLQKITKERNAFTVLKYGNSRGDDTYYIDPCVDVTDEVMNSMLEN